MAVSEYRQTKIREVARINAHSIKGNNTPSHIEYIDISSVGTGVFIEPPKRMSFTDAPSRARRILKSGDTILSTVRPNRRSFLFLSAASSITVASTGFVVLTPTSVVDARYLYYWVTRQDFTDYLSLHAKGAAYPAVSAEDIGDGEINLPPLPIQRCIAGILSAYDELIENSQKRIKTLEAMARALYREWFVYFRFPGYENRPRFSSPLGELPQGWKVGVLGDFVQFKSGFAFKSSAFTPGGSYRLVTIKNVQDGFFVPESDSNLNEIPSNMPPYCILEDGDILLSLTGNVGRVCLVYDGPFLLNQRVSKIIPVADFDWAIAYCLFRETDMRVKLEQLSNGVAQQNLSPILASRMDVAYPPEELRRAFATNVAPMLRQIVQLYSIIQNLRRTRDLLLPRLLTGHLGLVGDEP